MTRQPVSSALMILALIVTGMSALMKINNWATDDHVRTLLLLSFALLLAVIGNLLPKASPEGDHRSAARWRQAGRIVCFSGAAMAIFAIVWPGSHALLPAALIGLTGLSLVAFASSSLFRFKETLTMEQRSQSTSFRVAILLLIGIAGALGLIVLDSLFGDRVAQMSAIVWVLILGGASTWLTKDLLAKR
ncbi:MAG: hypothetical protein HRU11_03560 [Parvularculaceae bacterium]|nr:hypothetical protein [Parvularculaceae bacterium]